MTLFTSFSQLSNTDAIDKLLESITKSGFQAPFTNPYGYTPHPLALFAANLVKQQLTQNNFAHDFFCEKASSSNNAFNTILPTNNPLTASSDGGRRFAVLVSYHNGQLGFTQAFSDSIAMQWNLPRFVPNIISDELRMQVLADFSETIESIDSRTQQQNTSNNHLHLLFDKRSVINKAFSDKINHTSDSALESTKAATNNNTALKTQKKAHQRKLLQEWDSQLVVLNKEIKLIELFNSELQAETTSLYYQINKALLSEAYVSNDRVYQNENIFSLLAEEKYALALPFTGQDQPLPKLLHHAFSEGLTPLCFAEFWWGKSPAESIYHHDNFYPVARGLCRQLLNKQLRNTTVDKSNKLAHTIDSQFRFEVLFEDEDICIINKPEGFLSVPGKQTPDSVHSHIVAKYPQFSGPIIVHRLDMATSGILVLAKNKHTHQFLQQQFAQRLVKKRYAAMLSRPIIRDKLIPIGANNSDDSGNAMFSINLPMRTDFFDRPRQLVTADNSKQALSTWQLQPDSKYEDTHPKIWLYPHSGRTHQLRVHCAHANGLNAPIMGDNLYGLNDNKVRLMLHADSIAIKHPRTNTTIHIECPAPF